MIRMRNHIEAALLGLSRADELRTVGGYNWIQHLAMAALLDDRNDAAQAWLHSKSAAKSFVASLQLLSRPGPRQWFHLSDDAVMDRYREYMLKTFSTHAGLFDTAYARFKSDVAAVMTEIAPQLGRLAGSGDFSMLVNVYLNTVERLPDGVGVYFVHHEQMPGFTDVAIYPPSGFQRFIGKVRETGVASAMDEAAGYYAIVVSQHEAGNLELSSGELIQIEETLTGLICDSRRQETAGSLMQSYHNVETGRAAPKYAAPRF
ncbi:hypothetical protein OIU34_21165 [Pararhizobium sp. BT-229]|uniref:hypothetical protein n=1 Tax=Pararhizobium sp. BT-229 TaxID=2986923 RepID=UPI0021F6C959|nr:hypothetical protein [Pararhizobium sp. BT-229]MCV9964402.1 hypothetical protein [Pararhizobium sp. BT-229]